MARDLPTGWAQSTLGAVLKLKYGKSLPRQHRNAGPFAVYGSGGQAGWHSHALTSGPTIVVGRKGTFGEIWLSNEPCWPIDTTFYIDEFFGQSIEFWAHYLTFLPLKRFDRSSAVPGLRREDAESLSVFIPPAAEQFRIAQEITSSFQQLASLEGLTAHIGQFCDHYERLLLKVGSDGRLTRQWRQSGEHHHNKPSLTQAETLEGEPNLSWTQQKINSVGDVQLGRQRAPKYHHGELMRPYLRVANVFENRIDTSDVMEMHFSKREFETYKLVYGDILLNEGQSLELVGRPAMFREEIADVCFTNTLIRFRNSEKIHPEFALIVFRHYLHSGKFQEIAKITTNLAHLGAGRFANLEMPVPPIAEQREIARRVDRQLKMLAEIRSGLTQVTKLVTEMKSAVLRKAFRGGYNLHDPADESANILLDKIVFGRSNAAATPPTASVIGGKNRKRKAMGSLTSVRDAAREAAQPLTAQELFAASGYPTDAETELVERFYLDLRQALESGELLRIAGAEDLYVARGGGEQ